MAFWNILPIFLPNHSFTTNHICKYEGQHNLCSLQFDILIVMVVQQKRHSYLASQDTCPCSCQGAKELNIFLQKKLERKFLDFIIGSRISFYNLFYDLCAEAISWRSLQVSSTIKGIHDTMIRQCQCDLSKKFS